MIQDKLQVATHSYPKLFLIGIALLLTYAAVLGIAPRSALAHAELVSSTPADGATVQPGLTEITLVFDEDLGVDESSAELVGPGGTAVQGATSAVDRADRTKVTITTPALAAGSYTLKWNAFTPDDNALVSGSFSFTVASGSGASGAAQPAEPTPTTAVMPVDAGTLPTTGSGDNTTWVVMGLFMAIMLASAGSILHRKLKA